MTVYRISHAPKFVISTQWADGDDGAPPHIARRGKHGSLTNCGAINFVHGDTLPLSEVVRLMEWAYDVGVKDAKDAMRAAIGLGAFDDAGEDGR